MSEESLRKTPGAKTTREERLAAKLRENLRRRKSQARELADSSLQGGDTLSNGESDR